MLPDLKIAQLRHFIWVAELKSFHAAARKAYRTQPAISLSIRDLESKLGLALFEKRNHKVAIAELTPFGQQFISRARELISHHDRIADDVCLLANHKSGHLRLASVPSIASQILPKLLFDFVQQNPDLHLSFFDDSSEMVLKMVEDQQVDFGICHLLHEEEHSDKTFTQIWQDRIGVVCRKDHPLEQDDALHWEALLQYPIITNGTSRLLEDTEASRLLDRSQYNVSNMISLIAMLDAGFGITTLPRYAFPQDSHTLKFIPLITPTVTRRIGLIRLSKISLAPPAQAFVDFILLHHKQNP